MEKGQTNNPNGRPKNALNKRTEVAIELISKSKMSPLELDLAVMNWDLEKLNISDEQAKEIDTRTQIELRLKASDSVKPYGFPKLKATEITIDEETKKALTLAYANPKQS